MFLSEKTPLVAVDIGSNSIKVAQLAGGGQKFELMNFAMMPLEEGAVVDGVVKNPTDVVEALTRLIKAEKIPTRYAVASVAGEAVIIKKIKVPLMSADELAETIESEAEQYIPFDIDDVRIDFQVLGQTGANGHGDSETPSGEDEDESSGENDVLQEEENGVEKMEILLVAVQRDIIDSRVDVMLDAGLKPVIIDLDVFALVNVLSLQADLTLLGPVALIDLGDSFTHINILNHGVTALARDIPIGGGVSSRKLMNKFDVPFGQTAAMKTGNIPPGIDNQEVIDIILKGLENILDEVEKSFEFFSTTTSSQVSKVFLSGGGALTPGVTAFISDRLKVTVELLDPFRAVKVNPKQFDRATVEMMTPVSAVSVGLATRRFDYK